VLTEQAHAAVDQFAKVPELVGVAIVLGDCSGHGDVPPRGVARTRDWRSA